MSRPEEGGGHTRLIVKNVPKYVDEAKLRAHFSQQGDVTDVKLQRTRYSPTALHLHRAT